MCQCVYVYIICDTNVPACVCVYVYRDVNVVGLLVHQEEAALTRKRDSISVFVYGLIIVFIIIIIVFFGNAASRLTT